jgi:hypothetical protein
MDKKEEYMKMIKAAKDGEYSSFKESFDTVMIDGLDNYFKERTKEIYKGE